MGSKQNISANGTYVFDKDELDQLDELSLASVIDDTADSLNRLHEEPGAHSSECEETSSASIQGDLTINELLKDSISSSDPLSDSGRHVHSEHTTEPQPIEAQDDLIAPELLLGEQTGDRNDDDS